MPPPRKRPRLFQLAEHKHTSNPNLHDDDDDDFSDEWDDNLGDGECDEDDEYDEDSEDYEDDENDEYDEYDEGDDRGDDPEDDDGGLGEGDDPDAVLQEQRDRLKVKTNDVFEAIYAKYGQDFTDVGDEIDLETSEIVVNNGHFESIRDGIRDAKDVGEGKVVTEVGREYIECDVPSEANIVTFFGGLVRPQFVKLAQEEYLHSSRTRQMRQVTRDPIVAHRKQPFPGTVSDQSDNDDLRSLEETTSIWAPEIRRKVGRPRKVQQGDLPCFASVYDNNQVLASTRGNTLDQLQSSSGTSPIVLIESKKSSDHRLSVPLSVDRSAPMSVRKPAIEASSPRKRTTKISEQRGRTKFTKEDDELLLKSVREARKQGRNLWDKYYSVWEEHVKKHVSPTLSQPRHTAKSCRDRYRKYYYNTGLHWLTAPPEELLDEGSVVEVPHLSGLGVRPRKPRYSLILQRDLKPPVPTTSEDISGATKRVDLRSRRQVAKRNIPGTVSWTEAENHLEVHDLVQHAGLLGEASTTGKPLDVQGTRTAHPASHISSLERIGHGNGHSFPYIMTPPHSISSVTCATPISDRSSSFDPDSSRSVCVSLSRLAPCKSAGRTPFKDLVINQVDPAYSFSDEEEIETHSDVGQPSIQNRASVGFMARAVSRNCDVDAVLPASLRRPDTIRRTQPVSANKDSPQAPSPASSIKARQGTTASKISSPPRTQSMYKANTPVQLACKKRKRTHRQILDLDDIDELA